LHSFLLQVTVACWHGSTVDPTKAPSPARLPFQTPLDLLRTPISNVPTSSPSPSSLALLLPPLRPLMLQFIVVPLLLLLAPPDVALCSLSLHYIVRCSTCPRATP
uniref:Uncharacterized protein n=1 Tax=Zea mays TaxID=4577 RepID=A0A804QKU9_MAIZE